MAVDAATVKRIAHLARLKLDEADVAPLEKELNSILGWVEQLDAVDVTGVEPIASVTDLKLRWRADVVDDGNIQGEVLANAPEAEFGFFAVPKVIE
jgi:aspartyl-tRNA(Asn)/glutamyl-tRNA(Gln) amidotransferase subunit C